MKILIGCPTVGLERDPDKWLMTYTRTLNDLLNARIAVGTCFPYRKPLIDAENMIVEKALAHGYDYILRIDDDIWNVQRGDVLKLLSAGKDFISAVMHAHGYPYTKCALRKSPLHPDMPLVEYAKHKWDHEHGLQEVCGTGVMPVDLTAMPYTLIKTSVFVRVGKPYYEGSLSDSSLCDKMLAIGIQPYCHMDVQVCHRHVTPWNYQALFLADSEQMYREGKLEKGTDLYNFIEERIKNEQAAAISLS